MSNYKYRAWDILKKEWIFEGFHAVGEVTVFGCIEQHCMENLTPEYPTILERLGKILISGDSGLKDKNGKDRYDGDIIRRNTGYVFEEQPKEYSVGNSKVYGYNFHEEDEIIGSIFETPELLKP